MKPMLKKRSFQSFMACLGLRHDEDIPFARKLADLVGLGPGMSMQQCARRSRVIDVEHLVIKAHQGAFRNGQQPHRNIEIGEPEGGLVRLFRCSMLCLMSSRRRMPQKRRNEADGVVWARS